ncbi:MAG: serine kinase [Rhodobacteraceae bacterium]|nr:serine kinase [Paracoccaceae bacterium]
MHATVVVLNDKGLLILGAPGSGKSGLALQLLAVGAELVADDQASLRETEAGIEATAPDSLVGKIEARCMGILKVEFRPSALIVAVVDLDEAETNRLPPCRRINIGTQEIDLIHGQNVPNLAPALMTRLKGQRLH